MKFKTAKFVAGICLIALGGYVAKENIEVFMVAMLVVTGNELLEL